jgi:type IV pilus assembly protein PilA
MRAGESGFTLVELLVVMLILGIIAAVAIPSFLSQRDKAGDSDAKQIAKTAQIAIEAYAVDHGGRYTGADAAELEALEPTLPDDVPLAVVAAGPKTYTIAVASSTGTSFSIERAAAGDITYDCDNRGEGGCPDGDGW